MPLFSTVRLSSFVVSFVVTYMFFGMKTQTPLYFFFFLNNEQSTNVLSSNKKIIII